MHEEFGPKQNQDHPQNDVENDAVQEKVLSAEEHEAIEVASRKLDLLMSENFVNFATRFVNIDEYRKIITRGELEPREVSLHRPKVLKPENFDPSDSRFLYDPESGKRIQLGTDEALNTFYKFGIKKRVERLSWQEYADNSLENFRNFLRHNSRVDTTNRKWRNLMVETTGWEIHSGVTLNNYNSLLRILDQAHRAAKEGNHDTADIRRMAMKQFRDNIMRKVDNRLLEAKKIDSERKKILKKFKNDPNFLNSRRNLRSLFEALSYIQDELPGWRENKQYHIILIFNNDSISDKKNYYKPEEWAHLREGRMQGDELLGAIIIMPDKEMYQQTVQISSRAGKFGHPIFDTHGVVRFPKTIPREVQ